MKKYFWIVLFSFVCLIVGVLIGTSYAISVEKKYIERDVREYLKIRTFLEYEMQIKYDFFKREYVVIAIPEVETVSEQKIVLSVKDRNKPDVWDMTEINGEEEISNY